VAEAARFARALGAIPSGLFIVTAGSGDEATGFLASFVQQVGFEPPVVAVAVKLGRHVETVIRAGGTFCIAILDERSKGLLRHFARGFARGEPAFEGLRTERSASGVPYPADALAHLECEVIGEVVWTDHVLFGATVVGGKRRDGGGEPLIHLRNDGLAY
jgi:flavin reductase (DIM6/NTAB) family NADH-FMN oxidoreductase RutF